MPDKHIKNYKNDDNKNAFARDPAGRIKGGLRQIWERPAPRSRARHKRPWQRHI